MQPSLSTIERAGRGCAKSPAGTYSERARHRLRIAARLLPNRLRPRESPADAFCSAVLDVIHSLDVLARERLRAQVDWVEAYDRAEAVAASQSSIRRA